MSDKAIIVTDMPESCSKCKFMYEFYGVKKCQLLNVLKNGGKAIICVDKLNVSRKECCPLTSLQEHDKEIQDKAIEEFAKKIWSWCFEHGRKERINGVKEIVIGLDSVIGGIEKIIEQMKEVREWEKRISFEAGGDEEDYATKCNTCKHSCTRKNESDVLFYSLKECRYEPAKESSR